jgi:glycosyltransferase involved in cell wall biosynthesis
MDVSVVIPTRNRPKMLRRSVDSALRQSDVDLEVVVVIDGEDLHSEKVLTSFEDARLRWVHLDRSAGGAEARNIGARASHGQFIALLDDDDEWFPQKLSKQLAKANKATTETFVVTTQYVYRREGERDEVWPGHLPQKEEELSEFLFSSAGGFQTSTYLCPRELFLRIPFDSRLKRHQDWDWFLRLIQEPDFQLLVVEEPLSIYWVPLDRKSISGEANWTYSLAWADSVRRLLTSKAYAAFIVRICLRGAVIQGASIASVLSLLQRLLVCGGMTPILVLHAIGGLMISESLRRKMRSCRQWLGTHQYALQATRGR